MSFFQRNKDEHSAEKKLIDFSRIISYVLLLFAFLSVFLLFYVEMGGNTSPVEIYIRIISTVVALFIMSRFFEVFFKYNTYMEVSSRRLRMISLCLAIAGFVKVAVSVYYLIVCLMNHNFVLFFYIGEIIVWAAVAIFSILYRKTLED